MVSRTEMSQEVQQAYRVCAERLEGRRTAFLEAAPMLDDPRRRDAFYAAYLSLRVAGPACLPQPVGQAGSVRRSLKAIRAWRDTVRLCHQGQPDPAIPEQVALADTMVRFGLPMSPWMELEQGLTDLAEGQPVTDFSSLLTRARRIGVAHSSVFLRIITARPGTRRYRTSPELDMDELAHDPGVFAYIVRQMVELFPELEMWGAPRTNLPEELLRRHGLTVDALREMRHLTEAPRAFHEMMHDLANLAWRFYQNGVAKLTQAARVIPPDGVSRVDRILSGYKTCLQRIERAEFAPVTLEAIAAERSGETHLDVRVPPRADAGGKTGPESGGETLA